MSKQDHSVAKDHPEPVAKAPDKAMTIADLKVEAKRLCEEFAELQACPGNLNAEQQTLLTAVQGKAHALHEKIEAL